MLLPVVEEGIFSENWRIRQSSVELLGDLLFKVAGTSGKVVVDGGSDDEGISTEAHGAAIIEALGMDRRNEVRPLGENASQPNRRHMCDCSPSENARGRKYSTAGISLVRRQ
jgi:hypothetical protein